MRVSKDVQVQVLFRAPRKKKTEWPSFLFVFTSPDSNYRVYLAAAVAEEEEQSIGNDEQESDNDSIEVFVGHHDISDIDD